ncbi:uncharacterized protein LOC117106179, partial [Anneissia japonica]|uniref:uncharacterized protein LOC117106179 n=1 Tax=Anneissia japonica TaxID=1529436 RepID=UPI00142588DE
MKALRRDEKFISTHDPAQSSSDISKLIKFILTHNNFVFHDKHYQQISGTAMGTKMAPCYANIFMAELEDRLLANSNPKPSYYCRYIDDIFFIWEHGIDKLNEFERFANNFHPRIEFTINSSSSNISFLDVSVHLKNGIISTSVHHKPTDNHRYLDFNSSHHISLKKSLIYSQCLHIKRICSTPSEYQSELARLTSKFLASNYPISLIKSAISKTSTKSRTDFLTYTPKSNNDRIPMIFDYSPNLEPLANTLRKDILSLKQDPTIEPLFCNPPVLARRQPPNLKSLITSSELPTTTRDHGNTTCQKARCQLCKFINTDHTFSPPGTTYSIHPPAANCDTSNI